MSQYRARNDYVDDVPRKSIELPPEVAKAFVKDMRAYFAEPNTIKRDEIAGRRKRGADVRPDFNWNRADGRGRALAIARGYVLGEH
jgi:hypothetical protein